MGILKQVQDDGDGKHPITYCPIVLKLCLCEALYLPALRATFFQKKAKAEALRASYKMRPKAATS
jgi:hypothetical protein